jgi:hypothetical protein
MFVGQFVTTPYGNGKVTQLRGDSIVVVPTQWAMAMGQKPTFYMNEKDVRPLFDVGTEISCAWGKGKVSEIRPEDQMYIVRLDNWQLADGKSPVLFLNQSSLSLPAPEVSNSAITAMAAALAAKAAEELFNEHINNSTKARNEATQAFKKGDLEVARMKYMVVLETLQVPHCCILNVLLSSVLFLLFSFDLLHRWCKVSYPISKNQLCLSRYCMLVLR